MVWWSPGEPREIRGSFLRWSSMKEQGGSHRDRRTKKSGKWCSDMQSFSFNIKENIWESGKWESMWHGTRKGCRVQQNCGKRSTGLSLMQNWKICCTDSYRCRGQKPNAKARKPNTKPNTKAEYESRICLTSAGGLGIILKLRNRLKWQHTGENQVVYSLYRWTGQNSIRTRLNL